jgi:hypothetical protein
VNAFSKGKMDATGKELLEERKMALNIWDQQDSFKWGYLRFDDWFFKD